jgi:DNA-binding FrmR family transcriptional regulator
MDLYKSIASCIDIMPLLKADKDTLSEAAQSAVSEVWRSNLVNAVKYMKHGGERARGTIRSWLAGEKVHLSVLRSYEIDRRIESMEDCIAVLSSLIALLRALEGTKGVVLMIDEFQEVSKLPARKLNELNSFLHKLFDANPNGLQLFLSFTTGDKETINELLGDALQNRVSNTLSLPEFDQRESVQFLQDLLALHSINSSDGPAFTLDGLQEIVAHLHAKHEHLIPRELILAADKVLRAADPHIEDGDISKVDEAFVRHVLGSATP